LTALVALVCSLGILVIGAATVPSPWMLLRHLPLFSLVRPQRLTMFAWLIGAVAFGMWLAERSRRATWRWGAASIVLSAMAVPMLYGAWTSTIDTPAFVADIPRGANVLIVAGPRGPHSHQFDDLAIP